MGEKLGIAGSGAIATGLAACATKTPGHVLWARSDASASRATKAIAKACERLGEGYEPANVTVTTDLGALRLATFLVEAITEDTALKSELLDKAGRARRRRRDHQHDDVVAVGRRAGGGVGAS